MKRYLLFMMLIALTTACQPQKKSPRDTHGGTDTRDIQVIDTTVQEDMGQDLQDISAQDIIPSDGVPSDTTDSAAAEYQLVFLNTEQTIFAGQMILLTTRFTKNGVPQENINILFSLSIESLTNGLLDAKSSFTNSEGIASVYLLATSGQGNIVVYAVDQNQLAESATYSLAILPSEADLTVIFYYGGQASLATYMVYLYDVLSGYPTCADLTVELPTADFKKTVDASAESTVLPDLEPSTYTLYVAGMDSQGFLQAEGCIDNIDISYESLSIPVTLIDLY